MVAGQVERGDKVWTPSGVTTCCLAGRGSYNRQTRRDAPGFPQFPKALPPHLRTSYRTRTSSACRELASLLLGEMG